MKAMTQAKATAQTARGCRREDAVRLVVGVGSELVSGRVVVTSGSFREGAEHVDRDLKVLQV